jgi:hypothetical protein
MAGSGSDHLAVSGRFIFNARAVVTLTFAKEGATSLKQTASNECCQNGKNKGPCQNRLTNHDLQIVFPSIARSNILHMNRLSEISILFLLILHIGVDAQFYQGTYGIF